MPLIIHELLILSEMIVNRGNKESEKFGESKQEKQGGRQEGKMA